MVRTTDDAVVATVTLDPVSKTGLVGGSTGSRLNGVIDELDLPGGLTQAMQARLDEALAALAAGDTKTACNVLKAFVNQVNAQAGKQITEADAALLIGYAEDIRELAGC